MALWDLWSGWGTRKRENLEGAKRNNLSMGFMFICEV
jgi:hypothetical protein